MFAVKKLETLLISVNMPINYQFILPHKTKKFTNYIINTKEWQGSPKRSKAYKLLGYLITDTIYIYIKYKKCR